MSENELQENELQESLDSSREILKSQHTYMCMYVLCVCVCVCVCVCMYTYIFTYIYEENLNRSLDIVSGIVSR